VALHANSTTAQASVDFWKPAASTGWLVAVPQSSQAMWKDAYMWDDMEITMEEIQRHLASLERQYTLDTTRLAVAGHSMGGEVAIRLGLGGAIDAKGLIAVGPGGPFMDVPEGWEELAEQARERLSIAGTHWLRCYIIYGGDDVTISSENIRALADKLIKAGFDCEVERVPGAGHDYHPSYAPAMLRALEFISA
jgi:predicted esterase